MKQSKKQAKYRERKFVLDCPTNRKQYVRTATELSPTTSRNTDVPQGCVLAGFPFIINTTALSSCSTTCKIIKYADDIAISGMINNKNNNNNKAYRATVSYVTSWCTENYLGLKRTKDKRTDIRLHENSG